MQTMHGQSTAIPRVGRKSMITYLGDSWLGWEQNAIRVAEHDALLIAREGWLESNRFAEG